MHRYYKQGVVVGILLAGLCLWACTAESTSPPVPMSPQQAAAAKHPGQSVSPVYDISKTVKQGQVVFISAQTEPDTLEQGVAWLAGNKAPLYQQSPGQYEAQLPVSVVQKPGGYTIKLQNRQGQTVHETKVEVENANFQRQNIRVSSSTAGLQPEPGELETIGALKRVSTPVRHWDQPFQAPTPDCMNSPFGVLRYHNGKYTDDYHKGLDLRSPAGRPIKATAGGKVTIARQYRLHGGTVGIDHGQNVSSIYIHMSKIAVKPGETVQKGQVIGYVGSTGFATGPHLHWGLYVNGFPVNPTQWVAPIPRC